MGVNLAAAQAHAQWRSPDLEPKLEVNPSAAVEGVGGAISTSVADECNRVLGQELSPGEDEMRADLVNEEAKRKLDAWEKFDAFSPINA